MIRVGCVVKAPCKVPTEQRRVAKIGATGTCTDGETRKLGCHLAVHRTDGFHTLTHAQRWFQGGVRRSNGARRSRHRVPCCVPRCVARWHTPHTDTERGESHKEHRLSGSPVSASRVRSRVCGGADLFERINSIAWDRKLRPGGRRSGEGLPTLYSCTCRSRLAQSYGTRRIRLVFRGNTLVRAN